VLQLRLCIIHGGLQEVQVGSEVASPLQGASEVASLALVLCLALVLPGLVHCFGVLQPWCRRVAS
jgi:hypothetical protein